MHLDLPQDDFRAVAEPLLRGVAGELAALLLRLAEALAGDRARGWMDKEQAAAYVGVKVRALEDWMLPANDPSGRGRGLPHRKIGETVRFTRASIEAWGLTMERNTPVGVGGMGGWGDEGMGRKAAA